MNNIRIEELVKQLHLKPHPEGGFYSETYRSSTLVPSPKGPRPAATMIYFLLTAGSFSAFHRIRSDEGWHHYEGDSVHIHVIHADGSYECITLGKDTTAGEVPQAMVPAPAWFASECIGASGYALVGCTVSPGFDFEDFELAGRDTLLLAFPQYSELIGRLTRGFSSSLS